MSSKRPRGVAAGKAPAPTDWRIYRPAIWLAIQLGHRRTHRRVVNPAVDRGRPASVARSALRCGSASASAAAREG